MKPLQVDIKTTVSSYSGSKIGINVNYITDGVHLDHKPKNLNDGLSQMGVRFLRYPGGEKSDGYLWSTPPFEKPRPTLARTGLPEMRREFLPYTEDDYKTLKPLVMDFDQFMKVCRELGCEPYVVVCYDSMFIPPLPGGEIPTREQLLETACAWVRYANIEKGYGVKYWEIGNESYVIAHHNSAKVDDYTRDIVAFSQGMKAVDPSIKILANGPTGLDDNETPWARMDADTKKPWWATLLPVAARHIDGIAFHDYPCFAWESYDYYATHEVKMADPVVDHLRSLLDTYCEPEDAGRIRMALTETHSADWSSGKPGITRPGWSIEGTWGHALVLFDMLGKYQRRPEVDAILVWNTRWVNATKERVAAHEGKYEFWDSLDADNNLLPPGMVMKLWNDNLLDRMVAIDQVSGLETFATASESGDKLNIFIINKGYVQREVELAIPGFAGKKARHWQFYGKDALDNWPRLEQMPDLPVGHDGLMLSTKPVSITLLCIR